LGKNILDFHKRELCGKSHNYINDATIRQDIRGQREKRIINQVARKGNGVRAHISDEEMGKNLRLKVRFDYQGIAKNNRFPFRTPGAEQVAEEIREKKVAMLRNVPLQGIEIEDITMSGDVYTVYDEVRAQPVAYAPVTVEFKADSIEDAIQFIMKEEFRKVEIIEPDNLHLTKIDLERLLFKIGEELKSYKSFLEKRMEYWKS